MSCQFASPTDKKWFDDLDPNRRTRTHFACQCSIVECRNPDRVPPSVPPLDAAGIHSRIRFDENGRKKEDFIIVRSKYCNKESCQNFKEGAK